jgi:CubicO group peptidase (beta-lactamase class C family)
MAFTQCSASLPVTKPAASVTNMEQRIRRQFAEVGAAKGAVVVGIYDGTKSTIIGFGADGDTTFEIGSITKPMSGVLLADEVNRGRLALDDEAGRYLPSPLTRHASGPIRIEHLATFSSGLPFMPANWIDVDKGTYTPEMWRDFLATYSLPVAPGTTFAYGNVGFGVLGDVLALREQTTLAKLFHDRIFAPLHMDHSWLLDERPERARVAQGHDDEGKEVPLRFDKPIQAACCAVESTANDLLSFMRAPLEASTPPELARAFETAMTPRRHATGNYDDRDVGLGWFLRRDEPVFVQTGLMRGYRSAAVLDRARRIAVVVLAADAAYRSEVLAMQVRQSVIVERDAPQLTTLATLPANATRADVRFDTGLVLRGWSAPAEASRGETVTIRWYYEATRPITGDFTVFVHGDSPGTRIHGDHAPARPTSDWPTGTIVEDSVALTIPADHALGPMNVWSGLYQLDRMHVTTPDVTDGHDRVRGPTIEVR